MSCGGQGAVRSENDPRPQKTSRRRDGQPVTERHRGSSALEDLSPKTRQIPTFAFARSACEADIS